MSITPAPSSKFVWYELMTSDTQSAASFYSSVVGWSVNSAGPVHGDYSIFSVGERGIGGMMGLTADACAAGARPGWVGYVWVDDVDAYAIRVAAAGGSVQRPPSDIPGIGRFAVVADPHGAVFMLFKDSGGPSAAPVPPGTAGYVGWHELHAGDGVSAFAFYSSLFGWTKTEAMDMGPMGVYQLFAMGDNSAGGMMTKAPEIPAPFWIYYVNVDAIDAAVIRVTQGGGTIVMGPHQVPGGSWIVQCTDPQGAMFALVAGMR